MRGFILIVLAFIPFFSFSQEIEKHHYVSANMAWSRQSFFRPNYNYQLIEPRVGYGYFIKKNIAIGADVLYSSMQDVQDMRFIYPDSVGFAPTRYTGAKGFGIAPTVLVKIPFKRTWSFIAKGSLPVIAYKESIWNNRIPRKAGVEGSSYIAVCLDATIGLQYEFPSGAAIQFTPFRMNMMGYKKGDVSIYETRTLLQAAIGAYWRF